jgi:hypothetical protein
MFPSLSVRDAASEAVPASVRSSVPPDITRSP